MADTVKGTCRNISKVIIGNRLSVSQTFFDDETKEDERYPPLVVC